MSADDLAVNDWAVNTEVEQLKAQVSALEELLEVYEQETLEKSSHLEKTLRELAYSEDALWILKSILSSMGDGVVVVDETGQFLFLNPDAQMLLGIGVEPFIYPRVDSGKQRFLIDLSGRCQNTLLGRSVSLGSGNGRQTH